MCPCLFKVRLYRDGHKWVTIDKKCDTILITSRMIARFVDHNFQVVVISVLDCTNPDYAFFLDDVATYALTFIWLPGAAQYKDAPSDSDDLPF